ncbi:MAG: clan AA aspartic protease [Isosphaeraceae bacterium]
MIRGVVNARCEAVVRLRLRGPSGAELDVDAVVDSGFTASLALSAAAVASLALARQSGGGAVLADGSVRQFDIYAAEVEWDGAWRPVLVSAVGDEALVGMRLLVGHELRIAVVPGGAVEINPLP